MDYNLVKISSIVVISRKYRLIELNTTELLYRDVLITFDPL